MSRAIAMRDFVSHQYYKTEKKRKPILDRTRSFLKNKFYADDLIIITLENKREIYRNKDFVRYEYKIRTINKYEDTTRNLDIIELQRYMTKQR